MQGLNHSLKLRAVSKSENSPTEFIRINFQIGEKLKPIQVKRVEVKL